MKPRPVKGYEREGTMNEKLLLSIAETSETLGISVSTLYRLTSKRQIPFCKIGSRVVFQPAQLEAWIQEHAIQPAEGKKG